MIKKTLFIILLPAILILQSCFSNKCGDNVLVGEYQLTPQSITSWFPYIGKDTLTFENQSGAVLKLAKVMSVNQMAYQTLGEFCNEGFADRAERYFLGQWLRYVYTTTQNNIEYGIEAILFVNNTAQGATPKLFDNISYASIARRLGEQIGVGGSVILIADTRGNTFDQTEITFPSTQVFVAELQVNNTTLQNVYYFNREGKASLLVSEGKGIIGFAGREGEIWLLKN